MVGALLFLAIFADRITSLSPYYMDAKSSILQGTPPFKPGEIHPLGTDQFGRDVWSRVVYGARWSLLFGLLIMAARMALAIPAAVLSAFGPRFFAWLTGRLYIYTSAIPPLLIYLLILGAKGVLDIGFWPSVALTIFLLTIVETPRIAVALKGRLEELRSEEFVEGAVALGATGWRIFWIHLMPHLWPTLLNMVVAEMGRSLLVIAQLGLFGIFVGGGLWEYDVNENGREIWYRAVGVPEWGTMLADARFMIYTAPWIPLPPAFAFFFGVVGFNLLSQGLEGFAFSLTRLKEATTSRLSARWRWALLVVPLIASLWYYQGSPLNRGAQLAGLAARQAAALNSRSVEAYLATLASHNEEYIAEQRKWAERIVQEPYQIAVVRCTGLRLSGHQATALWTISFGFREQPPLTVTRSTRLVRRFGDWYDAGESFNKLRGRYVDMQAYYEPTDPSREAVQERFRVRFLSTAADHAYGQVAALFPAQTANDRPQIKYYPSQTAFEAVTAGEARSSDSKVSVAFIPGQSIRVSPDLLKGYNRRDLEKRLAYEMLEYLAASRLPSPATLPVLMGLFEQGDTIGDQYWIDLDKIAGAPLLPVEHLLKLGPGEVPLDQKPVYATETALLTEYLSQSMSQEQMLAAASSPKGVLAGLAEAMGASPEQFVRDVDGYIVKRIADLSVLNLPAGRARVPVSLTNAIAARAQALIDGDEARFLATADENVAREEAEWFAQVRQQGVKWASLQLLEMEVRSGQARVYMLQQLTYGDGRTVSTVVIRPWVERYSRWMITK